jgi:m7GpppX diphosphatase
MTSTTPPEIAARVESLIPKFQLTRLLNSDQAGRRISLLGTIDSQPALFIAERAAFDTSISNLTSFSTSLRNIKNLGANDIYSWFLANSNPNFTGSDGQPPPDFKLNLIYPCTQKHINKYEAQGLRIVTETPDIYAKYVRPYMQRQREKGALNWVFNIIEGRTEQEDVMYRESGDEGFLLLPDLNWDRKTMGSLHLLGIVERRDIWSVRDLKKTNVEWLKHMRSKMIEATVGLYPDIERDQLKLYVHCKTRLFYPVSIEEATNEHQINRHTTTSTFISCTSHLKLGARKPQAKRWVWRTSFLNLRLWRVARTEVCKMLA